MPERSTLHPRAGAASAAALAIAMLSADLIAAAPRQSVPQPRATPDPREPQPAAAVGFADPRRPLDSAAGDRVGLARSLRRVDPGLASTDVSRVYEAPDGSGRLQRRQGGLTAVFGRGVPDLGDDAGGSVPPGTVFRIGGGEGRPSRASLVRGVAFPRGRFVMRGVVHEGLSIRVPGSQAGFGGAPQPQVSPVPVEAPPDPSPDSLSPEAMPRFLADESYRHARLQQILEQALANR
jgi:hypothetical protein